MVLLNECCVGKHICFLTNNCGHILWRRTVRVRPRKGSGFNYFFLGPNILGYEMVSMNGIWLRFLDQNRIKKKKISILYRKHMTCKPTSFEKCMKSTWPEYSVILSCPGLKTFLMTSPQLLNGSSLKLSYLSVYKNKC